MRLDAGRWAVLGSWVMDGLMCFTSDNSHPLSWMLDPQCRHVFCAVQDTERDMWISYNWRDGRPELRAECAADFDLAEFWRGHAYTVVDVTLGEEPVGGPFILNNCVGHVKSILRIRSRAVTPFGLLKWAHRHTWNRIQFSMANHRHAILPGFGGGSTPAPPPPPPPPAPVARKSDPAVQAARKDEKKRSRLAQGQGGTIKTGSDGLLDSASTASKTLLT